MKLLFSMLPVFFAAALCASEAAGSQDDVRASADEVLKRSGLDAGAFAACRTAVAISPRWLAGAGTAVLVPKIPVSVVPSEDVEWFVGLPVMPHNAIWYGGFMAADSALRGDGAAVFEYLIRDIRAIRLMLTVPDPSCYIACYAPIGKVPELLNFETLRLLTVAQLEQIDSELAKLEMDIDAGFTVLIAGEVDDATRVSGDGTSDRRKAASDFVEITVGILSDPEIDGICTFEADADTGVGGVGGRLAVGLFVANALMLDMTGVARLKIQNELDRRREPRWKVEIRAHADAVLKANGYSLEEFCTPRTLSPLVYRWSTLRIDHADIFDRSTLYPDNPRLAQWVETFTAQETPLVTYRIDSGRISDLPRLHPAPVDVIHLNNSRIKAAAGRSDGDAVFKYLMQDCNVIRRYMADRRTVSFMYGIAMFKCMGAPDAAVLEALSDRQLAELASEFAGLDLDIRTAFRAAVAEGLSQIIVNTDQEEFRCGNDGLFDGENPPVKTEAINAIDKVAELLPLTQLEPDEYDQPVNEWERSSRSMRVYVGGFARMFFILRQPLGLIQLWRLSIDSALAMRREPEWLAEVRAHADEALKSHGYTLGELIAARDLDEDLYRIPHLMREYVEEGTPLEEQHMDVISCGSRRAVNCIERIYYGNPDGEAPRFGPDGLRNSFRGAGASIKADFESKYEDMVGVDGDKFVYKTVVYPSAVESAQEQILNALTAIEFLLDASPCKTSYEVAADGIAQIAPLLGNADNLAYLNTDKLEQIRAQLDVIAPKMHAAFKGALADMVYYEVWKARGQSGDPATLKAAAFAGIDVASDAIALADLDDHECQKRLDTLSLDGKCGAGIVALFELNRQAEGALRDALNVVDEETAKRQQNQQPK